VTLNPVAIRKIDISELEVRLGGPVPVAYRELAELEVELLEERGFDPKTLLVLNLERRCWEHVDSQGKFFLNGDGCGNYYFTELAVAAERVLLWSHDPPGIEDPTYRLPDYLRESEQECRVDFPVRAGELYICPSVAYGESILEPIGLAEWVAAVDATSGITHIGYREGRNPFNGETIRIDSPGLALIAGSRSPSVSFHYGRAELEDSPEHRAIAEELAEALQAYLHRADS
jgi:hypothetical protein